MPCGRASSRSRIALSPRKRPSLPISSRPRSFGSRRITADFAVLGRHGRDANIDLGPLDAQAGGAVLRQPPLGDVEAGDDLDARDQSLRQHAGRRRHRSQHAVDPHAHDEAGAEWLDVDVARPQLDGLFQKIVDRTHDRSAAREIAQAVDVVIGMGDRIFLGRRRRRGVARRAARTAQLRYPRTRRSRSRPDHRARFRRRGRPRYRSDRRRRA